MKASTRINLGPFSFTPPKRRPKTKRTPRAVEPAAAQYNGYPDVATWGVASALERSTVAELAGQAKAHARTFDGLSDAAREGVAVSLLAEALRRTCEARAQPDVLPALAAHLVHAGLGVVSWEAIARKGLA